MASTDLRRLHKLYLIDAGLTEVRKRAAALDPGRKLTAELEALTKVSDEVRGPRQGLSRPSSRTSSCFKRGSTTSSSGSTRSFTAARS
jgi:hypothetical protein